MSTIVIGLTGRIMICNNKKAAQKWAAMERSVLGKVVEVRGLGAEPKEKKKSDNFAEKAPVEVIAPKGEIRPEAEADSAPSLEERKAAIAATVAKRKAAKKN